MLVVGSFELRERTPYLYRARWTHDPRPAPGRSPAAHLAARVAGVPRLAHLVETGIAHPAHRSPGTTELRSEHALIPQPRLQMVPFNQHEDKHGKPDDERYPTACSDERLQD